ncbi:uroporphyrinogen decarboxylase family protein [Streptococcus hohhotensis]|uniref:Uroporphyrinogen decarboxylase family protein n=1 Tax=Streptococcus hohhotensis TaxID=2866998 RepID=A0ABT6QB86_9STRE|nr:uroporphyrinogen decarboxylase family protein [Streptococcus sp. IMAU 99199]MDI2138728.1 uroporphyrinogen decarboxylase family protein [Streptococcus sp. IMAU 99199]
MTSKRELVFRAIRGEEVERVPVGFWFHFVTLEEKGQGLNNPRIFQKSVEGHRKYVERIHPDFVKIMSDGFFIYPSNVYSPLVASIQELASIESIGENHPWIQQQVEVVQAIRATFTEDIASFYNIFSPISYLKRWFRTEASRGDKEVADLFLENPELFREILDVIAEDIAILTKKIIQDGGADGIYLSTQEIQDERITAELYQTYIEPSNIKVLEAANQVGGVNILHICGFQGASNNVTIFKDYPAQVFNWATHHEAVSLPQGQELFHGKAVLGGFENGKQSMLYGGTKAALQEETKRLLAEAGTRGVLLGADCTVPDEFELERLDWIRQAAVLK